MNIEEKWELSGPFQVLLNSGLRYHGGGDFTKTSGSRRAVVIDPVVKTRFGSHRAVEGGPLFQDLLAKYLFVPKFPEVLTVLMAPLPRHR